MNVDAGTEISRLLLRAIRRDRARVRRTRFFAPAYVNLAFRQPTFDSVMEEFLVPLPARNSLAFELQRQGFATIEELPLGLDDAYDCYCFRARVPQIIARPCPNGSYAVIVSLFHGTPVCSNVLKKIRGLLRAFPTPEPEHPRAPWPRGTRRMLGVPVRLAGAFGSSKDDHCPRRRWIGHPNVPRDVVPALVSVVQQLLHESYEFAIVCAVSDG